MNDTAGPRTAFVTGASGSIGSKLIATLLDRGWQVRALTRDRGHLARFDWSDAVQIVEGEVTDTDRLTEGMRGADAAWYLLHSMGEGADFVAKERASADSFATAARAAGVERIVYLGGLHPDGVELSEHLGSRVLVGDILLDSGVPTAALQAGPVLGEGSASFDMLRQLSERLPAAIAPDWLKNRTQPIAIDDALHYLTAAAELPPEVNRRFDIGGPEPLSFAEMMKRYARAVGLGPRGVLILPITTPGLAARWIGLVTSTPAALATPLIGSLLHDSIVTERDLDELAGPPPGGHTGFEEAIRRATAGLDTRRWRRTIAATAAACTATAVVGALATTPAVRWFRGLDRPSWQPPDSAFGPVWTLLYADLAAMSALTIADAAESDPDRARALWRALAVNLVLNAGWSVVFWRFRRLPLAALWAAALTASSADLTRRIGERNTARGLLLAPYPLWCGFATALSTAIARRNRNEDR
ncbi:tryptophan-rich sensory protein [Enemella evansiae]|uniref:tryptophan-rich sensory protein n=1 Tax=Enemella evansiae TaxID=2016499 RepID=UPI000B95D00E|nr:tryptophan-rich sensory protein [Enemella evansiae]OYO06139.1 DNA-binding protein [Enemella evansiae]